MIGNTFVSLNFHETNHFNSYLLWLSEPNTSRPVPIMKLYPDEVKTSAPGGMFLKRAGRFQKIINKKPKQQMHDVQISFSSKYYFKDMIEFINKRFIDICAISLYRNHADYVINLNSVNLNDAINFKMRF